MRQAKKDPVNFCYYLVAYIDILNQGEALKQLKGRRKGDANLFYRSGR